MLLGAAEGGTVQAATTSGGRGRGRKSEAGVKTQTTTWGSYKEPRGTGGGEATRSSQPGCECPLKTTRQQGPSRQYVPSTLHCLFLGLTAVFAP